MYKIFKHNTQVTVRERQWSQIIDTKVWCKSVLVTLPLNNKNQI